jgi:putative endonuclease
MTDTTRRGLGRLGETIAAEYLGRKGYTILEQNRRTPYGEIDIIASQDAVIAFVEVKTRASPSLGPPEISITPRKKEHMRSAAEYYIQQNTENIMDWRIDVITVQIQAKSSSPIIDHFENVIP